jgi:hypothetical protein
MQNALAPSPRPAPAFLCSTKAIFCCNPDGEIIAAIAVDRRAQIAVMERRLEGA